MTTLFKLGMLIGHFGKSIGASLATIGLAGVGICVSLLYDSFTFSDAIRVGISILYNFRFSDVIRVVSLLILIIFINYLVTFYIFLFESLRQRYKEHLLSLLNFVSKAPWLYPVKCFLYYIITGIFVFRSFFKKEQPWLIYVIGILFFINIIYKVFPILSVSVCLVLQGFYLISLDLYGELFASLIVHDSTSAFSMGYMVFLTKHKSSQYTIIKRTMIRAAMGLIVGKTALTATGRATVIVGGMTAASLMVDHALERRHQSFENELDRKHASDESERDRKHVSDENEKTRQHERDRWAHENTKKKWWFR
jgi:hypothetical protein